MAVTRFEDLLAWQKARVLTYRIYVATKSTGFRSDGALASQMQRASVSIMANIAEGFARNRPLEFQRYLDIAYGSCSEVASHLYVALDSGALDEAEVGELRSLADEVSRLLLALKRTSAQAVPPKRTTDRGLRTLGGG